MLPVEFEVDIQIEKDNQTCFDTRQIHRINTGESQSGSLGTILDPGEYTLSYSSFFGSESLFFTVLPDNDMEMAVTDVSPDNEIIRLPTVIQNNGYYPFSGDLEVSTPFFSHQTPVTIEGVGKVLFPKKKILTTHGLIYLP